MKKAEIQVGGRYTAKVSGKLTTVRVDAIDERYDVIRKREHTIYRVTNLATGRKLAFRSAAKFRSTAGDAKNRVGNQKPNLQLTSTPNEDERYATMQRLEPRSDSLHPEGL